MSRMSAPKILAATLSLLSCSVFSACEETRLKAPPMGILKTNNKIDFGDVQTGRLGEYVLEVSNVGDASLKVEQIELDPNFTSDAYKFKIPVEPFELSPLQKKNLKVTFQPFAPDTAAQSNFRFVTDIMVKKTPVIVPVTVRANSLPPQILIEPNPIDFGSVLVGSTREVELTITNLLPFSVDFFSTVNESGMPLVIHRGGAGFFEVDPPIARAKNPGLVTMGASLEPDTPLKIIARYVPGAVGTDSASGNIANCEDPLCSVSFEMFGAGTTAVLECVPTPLDFGVVEVDQIDSKLVTCTNKAPEDVVVTGWAVSSSSGTYSAPTYAGTPSLLRPGEKFTVDVSFAPTFDSALLGQPLTGSLLIQTRNNMTGQSTDPTAVALTGVAKLDRPPALTLTCSGDQTTPAGTAVAVTATPANIGGVLTSVLWTLENSPAGGAGTPNQWLPAPPNQLSEQFLGLIVGTYQLRATVTDTLGRTASCDTIVTAEGHGLRVELTWDGGGDLDLHVHNPNTSKWFGNDDCYYSNQSPIWDASSPPQTGRNPGLDVDNTKLNGPENVRLDAVALNSDYTIAAHNYQAASGRVATIKIFCGEVTTPTATFNSRPLAGTQAGDCTNNDFWRVARVRFSSQTTCTVTTVNTYTGSTNACNGF